MPLRLKHLTLILSLLVIFLSSCSEKEEYHFKEGDLFFQDQDCGLFCEAIEKVTEGYMGSKLSHVGVLVRVDDSWKILEAGGEGVVITAVDTFLNRSYDDNGNPKVLVGRIKNLDINLLRSAKTIAMSLIGKPYDDFFNISNDMYYCSELLYESFKNVHGKPLFELQPMTFKDPATDDIADVWKDYFEGLDHPIPEGELGLNPGAMSTNANVDIVYKFGHPEGYSE